MLEYCFLWNSYEQNEFAKQNNYVNGIVYLVFFKMTANVSYMYSMS